MFVNGVTIEMQDFFHSTNFLSDVRITKNVDFSSSISYAIVQMSPQLS